MAMESKIALEKHPDFAIITMNNVSNYNALSVDFVYELERKLTVVSEDPQLKCAILTGTDKAFCSGADIKNINMEEITQFNQGLPFMRKMQEIASLIYHLDIPIIAAVNGVCVGGGISVALACDYIIAAESATFSMIFSKIGLVPDLGSMYFLPRIIGLAKTKQLVYTAKFINAEEANQLGITAAVVPDKDLLETCIEEARMIASNDWQSIHYAKDTLNESFDLNIHQLLEKEALLQTASFQSSHFQEAIEAFKQQKK